MEGAYVTNSFDVSKLWTGFLDRSITRVRLCYSYQVGICSVGLVWEGENMRKALFLPLCDLVGVMTILLHISWLWIVTESQESFHWL